MDREDAFAATLLVVGPKPPILEETTMMGGIPYTKDRNNWELVAKHTLFTAMELSDVSSPFERNRMFNNAWRDFLVWMEFHNGVNA